MDSDGLLRETEDRRRPWSGMRREDQAGEMPRVPGVTLPKESPPGAGKAPMTLLYLYVRIAVEHDRVRRGMSSGSARNGRN
jgi:hypothetical protein